MADLWHKGEYQLGYRVTAVALVTAMTGTHCTILLKLAIQQNIKTMEPEYIRTKDKYRYYKTQE
jgi:hypothetical protein